MIRRLLLLTLLVLTMAMVARAADPVRPVIRVNGDAGTAFVFTNVTAVTVSIQNFVPGGSVFYTVDGSAPTAASTLYTEPFSVDQTSTIRAIAYSPAFEAFESDAVHVMLTGKVFVRTRSFGFGKVTVARAAAPDVTVSEQTFDLNERVLFTGIPDEGFRFVRWGDGITENPRQVRLRTNTLAAAVFEPKQEFEEQLYKDWDVSFGGAFEDTIADMVRTPDGGVIIAATSLSRAGGNKLAPRIGSADVWLIKIDSAGQRVWEKTYGGSHNERAAQIIAKGDGTYYVAADSSSEPSGNKKSPLRDAGFKDYWVFQIDERGELLWEESYGGNAADLIGGIALAPDGGFIVVGQSASPASGNKTVAAAGGWDVWAIHVNANRELAWQRSFGGTGNEYIPAIAEFPIGGEYLLAAAGMPHTRFRLDSATVTTNDFISASTHRTLTMLGDGYLIAERLGMSAVLRPDLTTAWNAGTWPLAMRTRDQAYLFGRHGRQLLRREADGSRAVGILGFDGADDSVFLTGVPTDKGFLFGLQSSAPSSRLKTAAAYGEGDVWLTHFRSILMPKGAPRIDVDGISHLTNRLNTPSTEINITSQARRRIFYTLNGAAPTTNSAVYANPIRVTHNAIVRAAADFGGGNLVEGPQVTILFEGRSFLEIQQSAGGTVSALPDLTSYVNGTNISVIATPDQGWAFIRWEGDVSGTTSTQQVTMNSNKVVRAVFGTPLTLRAEGQGRIESNPAQSLWPLNSELQLSAIPEPGHYFALWGMTATGNTNPLAIKMTEPRREVSALFLPLATNDVALTIVPRGSGAVQVSPRANAYRRGSTVTLTALPFPRSSFSQWIGGATGTNTSITITLDESKLIYAQFDGAPPLETNVVITLENVRTQNGEILFEAPGVEGTFELQSSIDLRAWTPVRTVTKSGATLLISEPATNSHRYFRLRKP